MTRSTQEFLPAALLALFASLSFACNDAEQHSPPRDRTEAAAPTEAPTFADADTPAPSESAGPEREPEPETETETETEPTSLPDERPVLASATLPHATPSPAVAAPGKSRSKHELRDPSLLPADTPAEHVAAFQALPVSKRDKAPIAGVGASGIHLDELETGAGWAKSRCEDTRDHFNAETDERVSLCFRVVHPREAEAVTVEWAKGGKLRHSIDVNIKASHAYLSRAWMPVSSGRAGEWTATVKSSDGSVLGQKVFTISK